MAPLAPEVPAPDVVAEVTKAQEPPVSRAVVTLPPSPPALLVSGPSASSPVLDRALSELGQLQKDLQGTDSHLVVESMEPISGWVHSDTSIQAALE